jgi:hypothetical protein
MIGAHRDETVTIKVLIAGMPGLLASVVRETLDAEHDMKVVGQVATIDGLSGALRHPIDVVVTTSTATGVSDRLKALLFGPSPLPLVAISADGSRIDVYGRSVTHGQGLDGLTGLIRDAVAVGRPRIGG